MFSVDSLAKRKSPSKRKPAKSRAKARRSPAIAQDLPLPALREQLLYVLRGGGAHVSFQEALADWPASLRGIRPTGFPHTAWRLLEHMRLAQWDILNFSRDASHVSPEFPEGYWPRQDAPPSPAEWERSIRAFRADLEAMQKLVADPATDLFARIPHGEGQTILREALLVADHNAYHLGELVTLRKMLGAWKR